MSLKSLDRFRKATGVRLTSWSAALCLLHALALGGFAYGLLGASLQQRDQQHIAMELRELAELYHSSGVAGVQRELESYGRNPFFVRLAGADGTLLVNAIP